MFCMVCSTKNVLKNPYETNILFTIVRNPYERCISEYYCPWSGNRNKDADVKEFNTWIRYKLGK